MKAFACDEELHSDKCMDIWFTEVECKNILYHYINVLNIMKNIQLDFEVTHLHRLYSLLRFTKGTQTNIIQ